MSVTIPFLTTKHLERTGLNNSTLFPYTTLFLVYDTVSLEALMIHLSCMWVTVVTVISFINPLLNARQISVFALVLDNHVKP